MQHKPWMFKAGITLKGINGALELLGGILLLAIPASAISTVIVHLTMSDAWIPRHAGESLEKMNHSAAFAVFYLLSHGVVKLFLSITLLRGVRWSYPVALGVFGLLLGYEVYRFVDHPSAILGVVIGIDAAIILLIAIHWRAKRRA